MGVGAGGDLGYEDMHIEGVESVSYWNQPRVHLVHITWHGQRDDRAWTDDKEEAA